jgi:hypothetical protein
VEQEVHPPSLTRSPRDVSLAKPPE